MIKLEPRQNDCDDYIAQLVITTNYVTSTINSRTALNVLKKWVSGLEETVEAAIARYRAGENSSQWFHVIKDYIESNELPVDEIGTPTISTRVADNLRELGYEPAALPELQANLFHIRDLLVPKKLNYVYIKIETGGLDGFDSRLGIRGAKDYPILRIVWAIDNNHINDMVIHHNEDVLDRMSPYAKRVHANSGLLDLVRDSKTSMDDAIMVLIHSFKKAGVLPNSVADNRYTVMVANGSKFVSNFLGTQMRPVNNYFSPKTVDLVAATSYAEAFGDYETVLVPALYNSDPIEYVRELRNICLRRGMTK